jgi:hypothetical protein
VSGTSDESAPDVDAVLPDLNLPQNPFPNHFSDPEWRQIMQQYNGMRAGGYLSGSWLNPFPFLSWRPFPDRPVLFFDHQGTPSLNLPAQPDPGLLRRTIQELWRTLNYHKWPQEPETRPAPGGPLGSDQDNNRTSPTALYTLNDRS